MTPGVELADEAATRALAERIGRHAAKGDVIALCGPLGAGKTTFAQGLAVGLDVPADRYVNSPTFTFVQIHPGRFPFYHVDLYRIGDPDDVLGLGLEEMLGEGSDGVAAIEWPERAEGVVPKDALWVRLRVLDGSRRLAEFCAPSERAAALLRAAVSATIDQSSS